MTKISPLYRYDPIAPLDPEVESYLDENFLSHIVNKNIKNPKLLVVFSGGNGVGKSHLAQMIGHELHGVVLENDSIKRLLKEKSPHIGHGLLQNLTWQYTMNLYARLEDTLQNGLIIRDGVIDWYFDRILPVFKSQGFELFIIAYDLSRKKSIELIQTRGDTQTVTVERQYKLLNEHSIHQKRFRSIYTPDITLTDDTIFDHNKVIEKISLRINQMKN